MARIASPNVTKPITPTTITAATPEVAKETKVKKVRPKGPNKKLMPSVNMTRDELAKLSPTELLSVIKDKISVERAKKFLVDRIKNERINSLSSEVLMSWTYKAVAVEGVTAKIIGSTKPKVTLTAEQFNSLTSAAKANLIDQYTFKTRAVRIVAWLIEKGMPITAEDVVYLTNGRIAVEGIVNPEPVRGASSVLVDGVQFS
jgi:hypothetical protein